MDELKIRMLGPAPAAGVIDPAAFDLVLKGRHQVAKRLQDNLRQAEELFEQAITIDPEYAPAHAGLAKSLLLQSEFYNVDPAVTLSRAEAAPDRALTLNPEDRTKR